MVLSDYQIHEVLASSIVATNAIRKLYKKVSDEEKKDNRVKAVKNENTNIVKLLPDSYTATDTEFSFSKPVANYC